MCLLGNGTSKQQQTHWRSFLALSHLFRKGGISLGKWLGLGREVKITGAGEMAQP